MSDIKRVWHAVGFGSPGKRNWTVSPDPEREGWETDCGHEGYGLSEAEARYLAECTRLRAVMPLVLELLDEAAKEADNDDYYVGGMCGGGYPREAAELIRVALCGEGEEK